MITLKLYYLVIFIEVTNHFEDKITETNGKLENQCECTDMIFMNNNNIDSTFLGRSKLHLIKV